MDNGLDVPEKSRHVVGQRPYFRGGLVLKAHKLLYHSTLGVRVTKNKNKRKKDAVLVNTKVDRRQGREPAGVHWQPLGHGPPPGHSLLLLLLPRERERERVASLISVEKRPIP